MNLPVRLALMKALVLCLACTLPGSSAAADPLLIGVLAKRGTEQALRRWTPLAQYLTEVVPNARFSIIPLSFNAVRAAAQSGSVDFILANPGVYVTLESQYGASRMVTLRNLGPDGQGYTRFGGVVFTRRDRTDLNHFSDLKGKHLAAVEEDSLGGFLAAWRELRRNGLDLDDLGALDFLGTHDAVVRAVLDGRADAGTVRTDTLERMAAEGRIDLMNVRVIEPRFYEGFDFRVSTALYPEWPLANMKARCGEVCDQVAAALLAMPEDGPVARATRTKGWAVPGNYQAVHELMRELKVGPYAGLREVTWAQWVNRYAPWLVATLTAILLLAFGNTLATVRARRRTVALERELGRVRQSRQRLARAKREWNEAFDAIGDPVFVHDEKLNIVQANAAYVRMGGVAREELRGRPYWEVFPKMDGPLAACRAFPEVVDGEPDEITLPSGQIFVSRSFGIRRPDGSYSNAVHILEDVTAQRQDRARCRLLAGGLEQAKEAVAVADGALNVVYANQQLERLLGAGGEPVEGRPVTALMEGERFASAFESASASPRGRWSGELELTAADGPVAVYGTVGAIRDEDGSVGGVVLVLSERDRGERLD